MKKKYLPFIQKSKKRKQGNKAIVLGINIKHDCFVIVWIDHTKKWYVYIGN